MQVYFTADPSSSTKSKKNFRAILKSLEKLGYNVYSGHIFESDPKDPETVKERIKAANFVVAEVSEPTKELGYEIGFAVESGVPVIALYSDIADISTLPIMPQGEDGRSLFLEPYTPRSIPQAVANGVAKVKEVLEYRLTVSITPQISDYLDWASGKKGVSRQTFLRSLIEDRMKKDQAT